MKNKNKTMTLSQKYNLLKRAIKDIHRYTPFLLTGQCILEIFDAAESFVPIYISGLVIDSISGNKPIEEILMLILISVAVAFVLQSSNQCFRKLLYYKYQKLTYEGSARFSEKILNMDYTKAEDPAIHRQYDRVKEINENYWGGILMRVMDTISLFVYGAASIIFALLMTADIFSSAASAELSENPFFSDIIGFVIIGVIIFLLILENTIYGKGLDKINEIRMSDGLAAPRRIYTYILGNYCGPYQVAKDIHIYNESGFILGKIQKYWDEMETYWQKDDKEQFKVSFSSSIIGVIRTVLIYTFVGFRAVSGIISAGGVIKDVQSFNRLSYGIGRAVGAFVSLNTLFVPLKTVYEFLDLPDDKYKGTLPTEKRDDNQYEFEFKDVYFKYPGSEQYVLEGINLKWRIGEKMALVGRNGCGKSTLVKLLCRLYDPTEGVITLNGIDIRKYRYEDYIALFSIVFQDSKMFSFSIAENVAASSEYDSERVEDCVIRAGMGERLKNMDKGIETCLYTEFDKDGIEISGGEAQKLCLARAIYKGAPFIVLDEPTAALDPVSEYDIYTKFNSIVGTKTAVYISHRLSSCKFCDEITVMDKGKIVERGKHEELLEKNGVYGKLWKAQSEYYKETKLFS